MTTTMLSTDEDDDVVSELMLLQAIELVVLCMVYV